MYQNRSYNPRKRGLNDNQTFFDFLKGKANNAATNIVGGAAQSASNSINKAFSGVNLPTVKVALEKDTKNTLYKAVGLLGASAVLTALIIKK